MSENESPDLKQMRDHIKSLETQISEMSPLKDENEQLKSALHVAAFEQAGVDPTKGIGKAAFQTYKGATDPAQILEFVKGEYDWEPEAVKATVPEGHTRLAALNAAGQPDVPASADEAIKEAEANGDWASSLALKAKKLAPNI